MTTHYYRGSWHLEVNAIDDGFEVTDIVLEEIATKIREGFTSGLIDQEKEGN